MLPRRFFAPLRVLVVALFAMGGAQAQTIVQWINDGTDFTLGASWLGGTAPALSNIAQFNSSFVINPVVGSAYSVGGLRFTTVAGSYTMTGTGPLTIGLYGIENQATSSTQTIQVPLIFNATSATILNEGGMTLSGTVTNNTTSGLTLSGGGYAGLISGAITGSGALTKDGSGVWKLSGTNSYTGSTSVANGLLVITGDTTSTGGFTIASGASLQIGEGASFIGGTTGSISGGSIVNNGSLFFSRSNAITYGGISGTGMVEQGGSGTLTLTGSNTYSGQTMITGGVVTDGNAGAFSPNSDVRMFSGTLAVTANETIRSIGDWEITDTTTPPPPGVTVASGAVLTLANSGGTFAGTISGAGSLRLSGGEYQTVTGSVSLTGTTTIDSGSALQFGSGAESGSISGPVVVNGSLKFNSTSDLTAGSISGAGNVLLYGSGKLTLSGTNTFSGGVFITGGTLADAASGAFPTNGKIYLQAAGTALNINFAETIGGLGGFNLSTGSTTTLNNTLTIQGNGLVYNGVIGGTGAVVLTANGWQTFGGANTYSGGTTISSGTLVATNTSGSATGTGSITIGSGGALQLGNFGAGGSVSGNIVNNGRVSFASTDATSYGGVISGSGSLSLNGTGLLELTGANSFSGPVQISSGTLRIGATNTLPTSTVIGFTGGLLDLKADQQISQFSYSNYGGGIQIASGKTLTIAPASNSYGGAFNGMISGGGSVTVAGGANSSVELNGHNSYGGGTVVSGGALLVAEGTTTVSGSIVNGPVGTGQLTVQSGGGIGISHFQDQDVRISNAVSLSSNANLLGGMQDNLLILDGTVTVPTGSATINISNVVDLSGTLTSAGGAGSTALTFASSSADFGHVLLRGTIAPSIGSITANTAGVIFMSASAVPSSGLSVSANSGYIGIGSPSSSGPAPSVASVLNLITNKAGFAGALGFDTEGSSAYTFTDAIDLTGFGSSLTLGSASKAVISGTITAPLGYAFGNGGGALVIASNLSGSSGVTVSSSTGIADNTLFAAFRGNNSYTGNLSVTNSFAVLDSATALPAGRQVTLGNAGYIGYTELFTGVSSFSNFLATRLVPGGYTSSSIVGLDSSGFITSAFNSDSPSGTRYVSENIDLSGLNPIYFGTSTSLLVSGFISAPNQGGANKTLSLLAASHGNLTITSPLMASNVNRVVIGSSTAQQAYGGIMLFGTSNYSGGTTLESGHLFISGSTKKSGSTIVSGPLGTGTITVTGTAQKPMLLASSDSTLDNPFSIGSTLGITGVYSESSVFLQLNGVISNLDSSHAGHLELSGAVALNAANTFSGGVTLQDGALSLGNDSALGTGTLTLGNGSGFNGLLVAQGSRTLANNIAYYGNTSSSLQVQATSGLSLNGTVTLNNNLDLEIDGKVIVNGRITGNGGLELNSGTLVLSPSSGVNDFTGHVGVWGGSLVFANTNALPTSTFSSLFSSDWSGYIGLSYVPANLQTGFIDRFDRQNTYGTIGLDSPSASSPLTYSGSINLGGFSSSPRLGSASAAILSGTLTPQSSSYDFGGGGGTLMVTSNLTDGASARSLYVDSDNAPLTLVLTGANTFTGAMDVYNSGLIFGANALPGTVGTSTIYGNGAYVGTADPAHLSSPSLFTARIDAGSSGMIVGFDTLGMTSAAVSSTIHLENIFEDSDPGVYLGTATSAVISGSILLPSNQSSFRFAGYKGGQLTIQTVLSDGSQSRSVVIGSLSNDATFGSAIDANGPLSSVTLSGNNTYTGGTSLNAGVLYLGSNTALGTGTFTATTETDFNGRHLGLFAGGGNRSIANNITLWSNLDVGGAYDLALSGSITGSNDLFKTGGGTLTLSGNNSGFTGDLYVAGGSVRFTTANSVGLGALEFGIAGGNAIFLDDAIVNGIAGDSSGGTITLSAGKTFTVNQQQDGEFQGVFAGMTSNLTFTGNGSRLRLAGSSSYTGATTIQSGALVLAANNSAFGSTANAITMTGGKLAVDSGVVIANPITITGGTLGGFGTFRAPTGSVGFDIKSNVTLAPGMSVGTLNFDGSLISTSVLILNSGGSYQWELTDASNGSNGWDLISVNGAVNIAATSVSPFTFKLYTIGLDGTSALAANFDPTQAYSWTLLSATSITGFTSGTQFAIDTSCFSNPNSGTFSVGLNTGGTSLMLNFSPVPEPSTYALMIAGLGLTLLASKRRKRQP